MLLPETFVLAAILYCISVHGRVPLHEPAERIINGEVVNPSGPVPFVVALFEHIPGYEPHHICGGSLISEEYVLTAAHCLYSDENATTPVPEITVGLGVFNWTYEEPTQLRLKVDQSNFSIHSLYRKRCTTACDIAILRLPQKVTTNEYIQTVKLPSYSDVNRNFKKATTYGWGCTEVNLSPPLLCSGEYYSQVLRTTNVSIISYGHSSKLISNVDNDKRGICSGDSGGPLISEGIQIGINDFFGIGGPYCKSGIDGYVSVLYYLNWIGSNTNITIQN